MRPPQEALRFQAERNEEQSAFNDWIAEQLIEAQAAIERADGPSSLQHAKDSLQKGAELITTQQKLIRLASKYEADALASDSDDEKCRNPSSRDWCGNLPTNYHFKAEPN